MHTQGRRFAATVLASVFFALSGTAPSSAQEVFAGDLTLKKTYIKTAGALFLAVGDVKPGLTPTTIRCPGATCTVRIELSSQFSTVAVGTVAGASVLVDGSNAGIAPVNTAGFDSTSNSGMSNVRTFSWMKKGLKAGSHTVQVYLFLSGSGNGAAGSFMRTLTIEVYQP